MTTPRRCIDCRHWFIEFEEDWSEITPGDGFTTGCNTNYWVLGSEVTKDGFLRAITRAESCSHYEEIKP